MLGFFKKKNSPSDEPAVSKKVKNMKCRKINYVDTDFSEFISLMNTDTKAILTLAPVNYYASKREYIMGSVFTSENFNENYVRFDRYEEEKHTDKSGYYPLDFILLSKALAKVGIIITQKSED